MVSSEEASRLPRLRNVTIVVEIFKIFKNHQFYADYISKQKVPIHSAKKIFLTIFVINCDFFRVKTFEICCCILHEMAADNAPRCNRVEAKSHLSTFRLSLQ